MSMAQEKAKFLKGTLGRLIVRVVGAGAIHGYAISPRIQQISKDFLQVPQGALYPAPHRLEERPWLEAEGMATATGREAKPYQLTHEGPSNSSRRCSTGSSLPMRWPWEWAGAGCDDRRKGSLAGLQAAKN